MPNLSTYELFGEEKNDSSWQNIEFFGKFAWVFFRLSFFRNVQKKPDIVLCKKGTSCLVTTVILPEGCISLDRGYRRMAFPTRLRGPCARAWTCQSGVCRLCHMCRKWSPPCLGAQVKVTVTQFYSSIGFSQSGDQWRKVCSYKHKVKVVVFGSVLTPSWDLCA